MTLDLITRAEWGAAPSNGAGNALGSPKGVAIHYEGPKMGSRPHSDCAALVRSIQRFHQVTRGWADIAYNLVVCEHGSVFEGRGAHRGSAANGTTQANLDYFAVCALVGVGDAMPDALYNGVRDAIDYLRSQGAGAALVCHSDLYATSCPGDALRGWVRAGAPRKGKPSPAPAADKPSSSPVKAPGFAVPPVKRGDKGTTVEQIQVRLRVHGFRLTADGDFGPATESAVRAFQKRKWPGYPVNWDGIVGALTWRALWETP